MTVTVRAVALCLALSTDVAFAQNSMAGILRSFFDDKLTPPEPFGFKIGWIAVRSTDLKAVADSLPVRSRTAASWYSGIQAAYKGGSVFITPSINGWICIVGDWSAGTGERRSVESIAKIVSDLSSRFGEAQGFATHRVI